MTRPARGEEPPESAGRWQRRALAILDMVESVRLLQAHEADVVERWRRFVTLVRDQVLPSCEGRLVKSLGDGLLLDFGHERQALAAARAVRRLLPRVNVDRGPDRRIDLRIGLHAADVLIDELDVFGAGVNLAARLAGLAGPGQIVMSADFHAALQGLDPLDDVEDLGLCYLKHIPEPVHAFRTRLPDPAPWSPQASVTPAPVPARPQDSEPSRSGAERPTCAILPFTPAGATSDDQIVAELLCDAIVARLAVIGGLHVISRWSARALPSEHTSGALAWSSLRAHHVVRGRVRLLAGHHFVSLELIDTGTEEVLWAGTQAFEVAQLLQPDDELSLALATEIARRIEFDLLRRARTSALPSLDGNQLQFSAAALMHQAGQESFARSQLMLEHLVERYPRQPSPRAWSAMWHVLQVTRGFEHEPERVAAKALDHVNRALDHDPACALAHAMAGFVHCHLKLDLVAADRCLQRAVAEGPSEPWAWLFRSVVAAHRGEGEDAWQWATRATMLSPLDPLRHYFDGLRASAAVVAERWNDAVALSTRSLGANAHHLPTLRALAIALVHLGRLDDARRVGQRVLEVDPAFNLASYLAAAPPEGVPMRRRFVEALAQAGLPRG